MGQIPGSELGELGYYGLNGLAAGVNNDDFGWSNRLLTKAV